MSSDTQEGQVYQSDEISIIYDGKTVRWFDKYIGIPVLIAKDIMYLDFKKVKKAEVVKATPTDSKRYLGKETAWEIFTRYVFNAEPSKSLAEEYGTTQRTIQRIGRTDVYSKYLIKKLKEYYSRG